MNKKMFLVPPLILWGVLNAATPASKEIKFKTRDLEKVQQELNRKKEETQRLKVEAEGLSAKVKAQEGKIRNIENALNYTQRKNSEVSQNLAVTKNKHDDAVDVISNNTSKLTHSVQKYYVASLLSGPQDINAFLHREVIQFRSDNLRNLKGESSEIKKQLDELIDTQKVIRSELDRQQENLFELKSGYESNEKLLTKKMSRQEILESEMRDLEKTASELASLIDVLRTRNNEEVASEKQARIKKQQMGHSPILPKSLPWPIQGKVITRFGRQANPKTGTMYISNGITISSKEETNVQSVADGKVLYAGQFMSYGSMVVVEHTGDWYSVYGHLNRWGVEKGQEMKKGDAVGEARPTPKGERETYFEIRFYGKPTDPLPWLSQ